MKSNRILSLLLAIVMVLSLLSGCGSTAAAEAEPTAAAEAEPTAAETEATADTAESAAAPTDGQTDDSTEVTAEAFDGYIDPETTATSIQEVVYLEGTWHEMGRQYAAQQPELLERIYMHAMSTYLESLDTEGIYSLVDMYMEGYKTSAPDLYDFVEGVAEELEVSLEDAAIATFCDRMNLAGFQEDDACMSASAWGEMTEDGHLVGACNLDAGIDAIAQYASLLVTYPENGFAVAGDLLSNAVLNSNGVMILYSGQKGASGDLAKYKYLNSVAFLWYVAAHAETADEAVEMLTSFDLYKDGNINVTDVNGSASFLENASFEHVIRTVGDLDEESTYLIGANHFYSEELAEYAYPEGVFLDSPVRCDTVERILLDNKGSVNVGVLARALGCREYYMDGKWSGENWELGDYQYHSPEMCDFIDKTIYRTVIDATDLEYYLLRGHYDLYTSHVPYTTAQYIKLTLGTSVEKVNKKAASDAQMMVWYAGYDLDHADTPDSAKVEYWNMANQKIQEGINYTEMAEYASATGNRTEALELYSLATSAYCRAQQYGQAAQTENNTFMK